MGLKIKTLSEILDNMVTWVSVSTSKLTDFNVGSATRTLLEAIALQLEEFYFKMYQNVMWAIENSIYQAFGFGIRKATFSTGYVNITFRVPLKKPYTILKGTKFATSSIGKTKYFVSKEDTIVPQNSTEIMVLVECTERGTQGNVPANTINIMTNPNSEIVKITNPYDFTNGTERETPAERKKRFRDYIKTLARGTVDAITYGCLEVEGVTGVWVDDSNIGFVKVYAHDIDGNLPDELKQRIIENERSYRAAGVEVEVLPVIKRSIDIYVKIYIAKDYDTAMYYTIISSAIYKYLNTFQVSNVLYLSELIQYIMNIDDVAISNVEVVKPYDDIVAGEQELIRSGNIVVEVYNV